MNDCHGLILSDFNPQEIIKLSHYIRSTYNKNSIIYASTSFIDKIIDSNITLGHIIPNKSNEKIYQEGFSGTYAGVPIIYIKEIINPTAIILPNFEEDFIIGEKIP